MMIMPALAVLDLWMGSPAPVASGVNFVQTTAALSGVATPVLTAYPSGTATQIAALLHGTVIDRVSVDAASSGYPRNGAFFLSLAASTPVTVDLTNTQAATPASAGDTFFGAAKVFVFDNTGARAVTVTPGASAPFNGPLGGSAPSFTVAAGAKEIWHSPAGWPVTAVARNLKFDPGAGAARIGVTVGGT